MTKMKIAGIEIDVDEGTEIGMKLGNLNDGFDLGRRIAKLQHKQMEDRVNAAEALAGNTKCAALIDVLSADRADTIKNLPNLVTSLTMGVGEEFDKQAIARAIVSKAIGVDLSMLGIDVENYRLPTSPVPKDEG